eukprot:TRINITY_DN7732_c0_g1_i1.p1 TRINITY_DN7732_c0_g1~~TRINITY_DN7732_c0_g1_i1.p1  ORF type:complete len:150 (-),score=37.16 TRINITY_DN7732_c0_g1_i1:60-449(-)
MCIRDRFQDSLEEVARRVSLTVKKGWQWKLSFVSSPKIYLFSYNLNSLARKLPRGGDAIIDGALIKELGIKLYQQEDLDSLLQDKPFVNSVGSAVLVWTHCQLEGDLEDYLEKGRREDHWILRLSLIHI